MKIHFPDFTNLLAKPLASITDTLLLLSPPHLLLLPPDTLLLLLLSLSLLLLLLLSLLLLLFSPLLLLLFSPLLLLLLLLPLLFSGVSDLSRLSLFLSLGLSDRSLAEER